MMAAKWVGNAGTHGDLITRDDVLDTFDILEIVIEDLFVGRQRTIKAKALAINARKGPARA